MRLVKVEAQGFKSFATKISLFFDGDIVGIVGPNGSGKSNINDAIKWVLGEISPKSLRGDSMEDIIFSGSQTTPAMDKAIVSLTFDNNLNQTSFPDKKITITRILKRGQNSQYYLNDKLVKLKEIKELVLESGISKTSLAIISQGTVQNIAEANPLQRRLVLEEAAGIAKYKARKIEALRKLDKTKENLEKITAITNELNKQLKPLKKQAEKATIYLQKKQQLENIEVDLLVYKINFYTHNLTNLSLEIDKNKTQIAEVKTKLFDIEQKITLYTEQKNILEQTIFDLEKTIQQNIQTLNLLEDNSLPKFQYQTNVLINDQTQTKNYLITLNQEIAYQNQKIIDLKQNITSLKTNQNQLLINYQQLNEKFNQINHQLIINRTQIELLTKQKNSNFNLFQGVKTILNHSDLFPNLHGMVQQLIIVNPPEIVAIDLVLKNIYQNLVVNSATDAMKCIKFLQKNNCGRATFILLNEIKPKVINLTDYEIIQQNYQGFVDVASKLVTYQSKYQNLVNYLLGNVLVTKTIEDATKIFEIFKKYLIVTLDGNVIRPNGIISGGSITSQNYFSNISYQIEKLQNLQPNLQTQKITFHQNLLLIEKQQQQLTLLINTNELELATLIQKNEQKIEQYNFINNQFNFELDKIKLSKNQKNLIDLKKQFQTQQVLLKTHKTSLFTLSQEINQLILQKNNLDEELRILLEKFSDNQIQQNQADYILNQSITNLAKEYGLTANSNQLKKTLKIDVNKTQILIDNLKEDLKNLGNINLDALNDYQKIEQRFIKIDHHRQELFDAKEIILSAIKQMDQIIIEKLHQSVEKINVEINQIFKTMFGGGYATLKYSTPNNLLETGIEIEARPPGKTIKNIKLFSGGEKSLIAICLLFAILKSKPLPLCILDEVEAALDDVNVMRYANYLKTLKSTTQFIVITHRIGTMAQMDKLFGATMQKHGVTSFFSVKLSDAEKLIDEKLTMTF